ncbi:MAG TPA: CAP domain-containing protein, partial [Pyrinomonadaceae bacterium]|nr:CAP domain-containing protein [Pyrinomonadaceae bacterium]
DGIAELARLHSRNMAASKQFSHRGQDGGFVDDRAAKLGIFNWLAIGENIAFMKGYPDPASTAVEKWMLSTSHKKNILSDQWRESAIGVAVGDNGSIYFTQVFIAR